jgi:hypothetical protein
VNLTSYYLAHNTTFIANNWQYPIGHVFKIYKAIILPVDLYVCETWSLALKKEYQLRVFETRALRIIFGPSRDEVTGGRRKLHSKKLHNLYSSPKMIRMLKSKSMALARHVAQMGEM